MVTLEQLSAAHKANFEVFLGLAGDVFQDVEKLVELNTQAVKSAFRENIGGAKQILAVKDVHDLIGTQANLLAPVAEKAMAYSRQVYEIARHSQSAFAKTVEAQIADGSHKLHSLIESISQNAPAGSEGIVAVMKTVINTANTACESAQKAARQMAEMAEANVEAAVNVANKVSQQSSPMVRPKKA
ncbi:MAG: phasin family protein [Ottowia sp.]|nr:phasin family protein [Ottowia sp.]